KALLLMKSKPHEITTGSSSLGKIIKTRANQVLREIHLLSAYVRLKPYHEMVLVGSCKPEHNSVYYVGKSIAKRFDRFIIIIFAAENFAIVSNRRDIPEFPKFEGCSREKIIDSVREFARANVDQRLPEEIILEEGDFLWEKYYETQFLEQRLNPKLFHRFIPKYALEKAEMKVEKDFLNKLVKKNRGKITLDRFLET
ncbi:MAG: DUF4130 domain-containing protein, partial [Candidatus Heimdallarchaeaceae archaeon]